MKNTVVIYHNNCADGFGAAWALHHAFGKVGSDAVDAKFYGASHGEPPPYDMIRDAFVYIVDFCYDTERMQGIAEIAKRVVVLDHHKSAVERLSGWIPPAHVYLNFDMERSGAMMAWNYCFPGKEPPQLIKHIQDRDLWRFELPNTREIQMCVFSYPYDFAVWDHLMLRADYGDLLTEGRAIARKHDKDINEFINNSMVHERALIDGHHVPLINVPYTLGSDTCHLLAQGEAFAAYYWDQDGWRQFGLRSEPEGLDVSAIAKKFGGGGHKHAAGFRVPLENFNIKSLEIVN